MENLPNLKLVTEEDLEIYFLRLDAQMYRERAYKHLEWKNECLRKIKEKKIMGNFRDGHRLMQRVHFHRKEYELNTYLADSIQKEVNSRRCDSVTLEMHEFRVKEGMAFLDMFLDEHISRLREEAANSVLSDPLSLELFFITGRGKHSPAGPRIKPATIERLCERSLGYEEVNPGFLRTIVCEADKLTHELG